MAHFKKLFRTQVAFTLVRFTQYAMLIHLK